MRLSLVLQKLKVNHNAPYWNRRVWEKGYVGPPFPMKKATGLPRKIVSQTAVAALQQRFLREWNVMQWLANPYLNEVKEKPFVERYGDVIDQWTQEEIEAKQRKMPNKPKIYKVIGEVERRRANVGNLLHSHRTVEGDLKGLIRRNRWD